MANKAKHAYGSRANLAVAIEAGKVDAYDILFLNGENESPAIGWIDKDGNPVIVGCEEQVVKVTELPTTNGKEDVVYIYNNEAYIWDGEKCTSICKPTDVSALESQVTELETEIETKVDAETVQTMIEKYTESAIEVVEF
jgi:hypothetical protein